MYKPSNLNKISVKICNRSRYDSFVLRGRGVILIKEISPGESD